MKINSDEFTDGCTTACGKYSGTIPHCAIIKLRPSIPGISNAIHHNGLQTLVQLFSFTRVS